jgi:hypothetical protein
MGALINLYGHTSSASGLMHTYMLYSLSKPHIWAANSVSIADWWALRSRVTVTPAYSAASLKTAAATIRGASDPDTAIEMVFPKWNPATSGYFQVLLDGVPARADQYRITQQGIKVKVGGAVTKVEVRFIPLETVLPLEWCDLWNRSTWLTQPVGVK